MTWPEQRPYDQADLRVHAAMARGHYPEFWLGPSVCRTCGHEYPCGQFVSGIEPEEPIDLGARWLLAAPIVGLVLLAVVFVVLGR